MRFIKLGLISVVVMFVILSAMGLLLPSRILVSRAVDIRGSTFAVKTQLFQLSNWQNWMADAAGNKSGQLYNDKKSELLIGETRVEATAISDSSFQTTWYSKRPMYCTLRLIDHHRPDSMLTVQWQMEQEVKWYFWEKFASITRDEIWGASMEKSLENLRSLVEQGR